MVEMCKQSHWNLGANFISIDSEQMVMKVKAVDALLEPLAADGINGNQSKRDIQGKEEDSSVYSRLTCASLNSQSPLVVVNQEFH